MSQLERIRDDLTDKQQEILTATWDYFREHKHWIPVRLIHQTYGGKPKARPYFEQLGGSIVIEYEENSAKFYRLTFLGILLTKDGPDYEQLLARYLGYVSEKCAKEPLRTEVTSHEVAAHIGLDSGQVALLGYLIREGHFYSSRGTNIGGEGEWSAGVPDDVEDFPQDLVEYVHARAVADYDPDVPLKASERSSYLWGKVPGAARKEVHLGTPRRTAASSYVDVARIAELQAIDSLQFDLARLIELCEELNVCNSNGCYLAVAVLARALLDHIPPIFGASTFSEIANNYKGTRSFKDSMQHLDNSCRKIADAHLHVQIRKNEVLPNKTQVNFSNDLDVLLAEIVRVLR